MEAALKAKEAQEKGGPVTTPPPLEPGAAPAAGRRGGGSPASAGTRRPAGDHARPGIQRGILPAAGRATG